MKTASAAIDGYSLALFAGFSDEMEKIAGRAGEIAKTLGHYLAGGAKTDAVVHLPQGAISKALRMKPKTMVAAGMGPRVGSGIEALKNPATRIEAAKVLGARAGVGAAALGTGAAASQHHHQTENKQLEEAYLSGARDMFAQGQGS